MDFLRILDDFIEDTLASGFSEDQIASFLLEENRILYDKERPIPITEAIRRVKRKVSGVNVTVRKYGRKDPRRSIRMKMVARRSMASRRMAMRRYRVSPKFRQVQRVMKQRRALRRRPPRPTVRRFGYRR